ncbi:MAG: zinc ribbon domain-containing protein [Candidatus Dojkabacteria bacterium]|jgi:hypothetical protein
MEQFILDFFGSVGKIDFDFVIKTLSIMLVVFWIVVIYWVWFDASERTSNKWAKIGYVVLTTLLNIIGLLIYLLIRPSRTIEEIYWADLERRYLKYETSELGDCPKCGTQLEPGYKFCPNCRYKLKIKCPSCGVYVERHSKYCANCGNELNGNKKFVPKEVPSKEVMEEQIATTKEQVVEAVESNKVKYSSGKGIAVKLSDMALKLLAPFKKTEKEKEIKKEKKSKKKK